ncbi:hypothetical protein ACJQWK_07437 [Exserohilum turcicum]|uniref:Uncharacterized protein n=1 Tax=Exserohilum turcicum (strain 28A) TaxID=671987 RepID=R0KC50_EXST2|nr:uncharacterized protein SETTUDRAFT_175529 [Exserohilum turcica Et28A]EOA90503.1 hypothetical protein SETTUDRAFT_175529 [Exserohilum turcica Et28A]
MPMMLTPDLSPDTPDKKLSFAHSLSRHPIRIASICGHSIHPSSSEHVPWCPQCILSRARAKTEAALKDLAALGGLKPAKHMRSQQWNSARKGFGMAKQQLEKVRRDDQLRWEKQREWDDAHQQSDSRPAPAAAVLPQSPSLCAVCDSMSASYPTSVPEAQPATYVAWWEQAGASRPLESSSTPRHHRHRPCRRAKPREGSTELLRIVTLVRQETRERNALREAWHARNKTEAAVRRKHGLGPDFEIAASFWDWPIPGFFSWRNHRSIKEQGRMAERRARGNTTRPRPPRSSLSYSETPEQVQVAPDFIETLAQREEREELERQTSKVAREVGYLYFVGGGINGLESWRDDFERSDKDLIVRIQAPCIPSLSSDTWTTEVTQHGDDDEEPDWMDIDD